VTLPPIPTRYLDGGAISGRFILLVCHGGQEWGIVAWPKHGNRARRIERDFHHHDERGEAAVLLDRQQRAVLFTNELGKGAVIGTGL